MYPARPWPHKNHDRLFVAFAELRRRHPDLELVLTAYGGPTPPGVRSLGHVSRDELVRLYRTASGLVFPSLYEGFGQPPLEAMACGCPVASSMPPRFRRSVGTAHASSIRPRSTPWSVRSKRSWRALKSGASWGLPARAQFSWDETARAHDAAYEAAVDIDGCRNVTTWTGGSPSDLCDPPGIHGAGDEYWGLAWPALEWLENELREDMSTLETGSGASTIVSPQPGRTRRRHTGDARRRVSARVSSFGVSSERVSFEIGFSHEVLPRLPQRVLDVVLLDGAHGFPYPVLDWWYVAAQVRVGGCILLDDAYMPPVAVIVDHARASKAWDVECAVGYRTVVVRKLADELPPFDWEGERIGGRMTFRYLPPAERIVASARHRAFSTRAGLALVELYRRGSGLKWRKTG